MEDDSSYYLFEAGTTLGCDVAEDVHPFHRTQKAFRITKIKKTCPYPQQLQVGDIITYINDKQVSSMDDVFKRKFTVVTTLRVIPHGVITLFQQQQQERRQHQQQQPQQQPPPPPQQQQQQQPPPLAPVVTDRPSNTTRKRQRNEHHDAETKEEGKEEEAEETPKARLFGTPPQPPPPAPQEGFCTPAANIPQEPQLTMEVFDKNAKSRMRVNLACRLFGMSIMKCIWEYVPAVEQHQYASYILLANKTNRFIDIMTAKNGCGIIDSSTHEHIEELFDFVKFLHMWREQCLARKERYEFLAQQTYEDLCWVALGTALIAMLQLPEGESMVQCRGGSDHLEELFCMMKNKNACASAQDSNSILARQFSASFMSLIRSRKSNGEGRKVFTTNEVQSFKVQRPNIQQTARIQQQQENTDE